MLLLFLLFLYLFFYKEGFKVNETIEICSEDPLTGYMRDGKCSLIEDDKGTHSVCAGVTSKFLEFSKEKGNNLIDPSNSFPGLEEGDYWCLCANRWKEAFLCAEDDSCTDLEPEDIPKINLGATHIKTLDLIPDLHEADIRERYIKDI
jgi:uncharacterized protein